MIQVEVWSIVVYLAALLLECRHLLESCPSSISLVAAFPFLSVLRSGFIVFSREASLDIDVLTASGLAVNNKSKSTRRKVVRGDSVFRRMKLRCQYQKGPIDHDVGMMVAARHNLEVRPTTT
jgi:hypothetical protein